MTRGTSAEGTSELHWHKSSYSSSNESGDCVEIAATPPTVHVRDSKNPGGPRLALEAGAWTAFVVHVSGV
ncbi:MULTISPECIES: DUF397 domain-containing protein [unclassified Streptomyces]|uniref:DUF397 domain-containing protein n=1 Tax=unclassified Streptomyces TaxID=2593676 RepID=UPI0033BBAD8F